MIVKVTVTSVYHGRMGCALCGSMCSQLWAHGEVQLLTNFGWKVKKILLIQKFLDSFHPKRIHHSGSL